MLNSIILGNSSKVPNRWEIFDDKYGNVFVGNASIRQKLRYGKGVVPSIHAIIEEDNVVSLELPLNIFISNNNKNMNMTIMNYKASDSSIDDSITYVTFTNKYTVVKYETDYNICQTFSKSGIYQGCALKHKTLSAGTNLATFYCRDVNNKKFVRINIIAVSDDGIVGYSITDIPRNENKPYFSSWKRSNEKGVRIRMSASGLMTSTVITSPKTEELANFLTSNVNNPIIIVVDPDSESDISDKLSGLSKNRVRAVTVIDGIKIPFDVLKKEQILYVFNIDSKTNECKCVKSN